MARGLRAGALWVIEGRPGRVAKVIPLFNIIKGKEYYNMVGVLYV